jgi:hypothetical protein
MFLSDPPASDLAAALYDEDRASDGYVSNTTRLQPDAQLAGDAPAAVRAAVSSARAPAGVPSV